MKSSSKILIGGIILLVMGFILCLYSETRTQTGFINTGHYFMPTYHGYTVYPYRNLGIVVIFLSFVCFVGAGISAAKARKKEREKTIASAPVQQPPPQYAPQQQIPQPQPTQATQIYQQPPPPVQQPAPEVTPLQYCPSCGKKIQPDWSICGYCGRKLR